MAPAESGVWNDLNTGLVCKSLGLDRYTALLNNAGLTVAASFTDIGRNHYYDMVKKQLAVKEIL